MLSTPSATLLLLMQHRFFLSHSSTLTPINYFPILLGTLSEPFFSSPIYPPLCPSLLHPPTPDGEGIDPSSLVRSVTSTAHFSVTQRLWACPCQPPCQGSQACQLLHLERAAAADATHLQVNVFWGRAVSERPWVKRASHPIRAEQIRGAFYIAK